MNLDAVPPDERPAWAGVGIWTAHLDFHPAGQVRDVAAEIEDLGYTSLWVGENRGREPFTQAAILLAASTRLVVASGVAAIGVRDARSMLAAQYTLAEAFPGRYLLGLGVSHAQLITGRGHPYPPPLQAMRDYLDTMDAAANGWYRAVPPARPPRVLAALGPRMLALAADRSDGAHTYLVTPAHTTLARTVLGPRGWLIAEQAVVVTTDPAAGRATGRDHLRRYLPLPHYVANLRRLGFTDEDLTGPGSDRLVDAIVAWGDPETIAERITAHRKAGADHVCVQVLGVDPCRFPVDDVRALAPAVTGLA
jgi:probable F420-dependent oxidoreductase